MEARSHGKHRPLLRALARGLGIVAAVIGVGLVGAMVTVVWLTQAERGRAALVEHGLPIVNGLLPGDVHAERVVELGWRVVELRGVRVLDPTGAEVGALRRARVELRPLRFLRGEIAIEDALIEGLSVDLRQLGDARRGLIAAFVDPDAPDSPPSEGPPPNVQLRHVALRECSVRLPELGTVGQLDLTGVALEGRYALSEGDSTAKVERLSIVVERGGEPLLHLQRLAFHLPPAPEPVSLGLAVRVGGSALKLTATLAADFRDEVELAELSAELELRALQPADLSRLLGLGTALDGVRGPFDATLRMSGRAGDLQAQLAAKTPGGDARLDARFAGFKRLTWSFASERFEPVRVLPELALPAPFVVGARATGAVELPEQEGRPIALSLDADTQLNGHRLPRVSGSTRVLGSALDPVHVVLADAHSRVALDGGIGADGSLRAALGLSLDARTVREVVLALGETVPDAQGVLSGRLELAQAGMTRVVGRLESSHVEWPSGALHALALDVDLRGRGPLLSGRANLSLEEGTLLDVSLRDLSLSLAGEPEGYTLQTSVTLPERASLALRLGVREISERGLTVSGSGQGQIGGEPWKLELAQTRLRSAGELDTRGVALDLAGQRLEARGRYAAAHSDLLLVAHALDLARMAALVKRVAPGVELPELRGSVSLSAALSGHAARPRAELLLRADGLATAQTPALDLSVNAALDGPAGSARLQGDLRSSDPQLRPVSTKPGGVAGPNLRTGVLVESSFARSGDFTRALIAGHHRLALDLERFDLDLLDALGAEPLPVDGQLSGRLSVELGEALKLAWQARAALRGAGESRELAVTHALSLDQGRLHTQLSAGEATDPLLGLEATLQLSLARTQLLEQLSRARGLLSTQPWSVSIDLPARDLRTLPLASALGATLPAVRASGTIAIDHAPNAEPDVQLALSAEPLDVGQAGPQCRSSGLVASLTASANAGKVTGALRGTQAGRTLVDSQFAVQVPLAKLLAGERMSPDELALQARLDDVQLASLPVACEWARGRVDLDLSLVSPLGPAPEAKLVLDLDEFSMAGETVDVRLELDANASSGNVRAEVRQARAVSKLSGSIPLRWSDGALSLDAASRIAAKLDLNAFPIAPFLPPSAGLSYAAGTIAGSAALNGTIREPRVAGQLELRDVAFTVTELAQPIDDIQGRIRFDGDQIVIERLRARDKEGTLQLSARTKLKSLEEGSGTLHLVLSKFPLRQNGEVAATVQGDIELSADVSPGSTHIQASITKFDTYLESGGAGGGLELTAHPDLVVDGVPNRIDPAAAAKASAEDEDDRASRSRLRIDIRSKDRFWVKRDDFSMRLLANVSVELEGEDLQVGGDIAIDRGYIDLLGKMFEIDEGRLQFDGAGPTPDPIVRIKAHQDNRKTGEVIGLVISGRSSAPKLVFTVDGSEVDVAAAVAAIYESEASAAASSSMHTEEDATVQTESVLRGLTAGLLATAARHELGAFSPILTIDPGDDDSGTEVRAGFEFDSLVPAPMRDVVTGVYFEGIVSSDKEGAESGETQGDLKTGALLELYFPYNLFAAGQYGPGTTWSLDVGWQL